MELNPFGQLAAPRCIEAEPARTREALPQQMKAIQANQGFRYDRPTGPPTCLPACLPTYLPTDLPTYLQAYVQTLVICTYLCIYVHIVGVAER